MDTANSTGYASLGRAASQLPDGPHRLIDQAVTRVEDIIGLVDQMQNALGSSLDRNLGQGPTDSAGGKNSVAPCRAGSAGHLLDRLDSLHTRASEALDMASRLDNRL